MTIQIGSEQYAWVMAGCIDPSDPYYNKLDHMFGVCGKAGFTGFEPIDKFMFDLYDAGKLREAIEESKVGLSSIVLLDDWLNPQETEEEKAASDKLITILSEHFPETVMMLCQMPTTRDENHLDERHDNLISCINEISKRATDKGIKCSYHPNSPDTSIWRTEEDYKKLLPRLDSSVLKWTPDVGHIAALKMDPKQLMLDYQGLINHVHYKDMNDDSSWALMGEGIIDFEGITQDLVDNKYEGWIIVEDECPRSETEPDVVTVECGEYSQEKIMPIIQKAQQA
jgi:inosose dehydratase